MAGKIEPRITRRLVLDALTVLFNDEAPDKESALAVIGADLATTLNGANLAASMNSIEIIACSQRSGYSSSLAQIVAVCGARSQLRDGR